MQTNDIPEEMICYARHEAVNKKMEEEIVGNRYELDETVNRIINNRNSPLDKRYHERMKAE